MLRTSRIDIRETITSHDIVTFLVNAAWAICSTHHTVLNATPGAAVFGRDMLFDILYLANWQAIGQRQKNISSVNCVKMFLLINHIISSVQVFQLS